MGRVSRMIGVTCDEGLPSGNRKAVKHAEHWLEGVWLDGGTAGEDIVSCSVEQKQAARPRHLFRVGHNNNNDDDDEGNKHWGETKGNNQLRQGAISHRTRGGEACLSAWALPGSFVKSRASAHNLAHRFITIKHTREQSFISCFHLKKTRWDAIKTQIYTVYSPNLFHLCRCCHDVLKATHHGHDREKTRSKI